MFCENCGHKLNKDDQFCEHCGFEVKEFTKRTEIDKRSEKFVPKFTLIFVGLILLAFLAFWVYKFEMFAPVKGTSTASVSALWGQFIVSLLAIAVVSAILILLDTRKKPVSVLKLVSFWLIIIMLVISSSYYAYKKISWGKTHAYQEGQEFNYGPYSFTIDGDFSDIPYNPEDCSGYKRLIDWCESNNDYLKNQSEIQKNLSLKIKIKNNSKYEQPITTHWFQVFGASGEQYGLNRGSEFETSNLSSGSVREGTFSKIYVNKNESEFNIKITLPNKAEQIVKIKNK